MAKGKLETPLISKSTNVLGSKMHYVTAGEGESTILFLHGIPTSSYLWRNIIPYLSPLATCVAPDLMGFGLSDKLDIEYSIFDHIKYMDAFIEQLQLKNIILVMHGWGSVIGFNYAMHHPKNCKGLVFYEAFLRSLENEMLSLPFQDHVVTLKEQADFDEMIANGALFVDRMLPHAALQPLSKMDIDVYRQPFQIPGSGKPIAQYLHEIPNQEQRHKVSDLVVQYTQFLEKSLLPKLMLYSVPGFITTMATAMWARDHLPNIEIVDIGEELHLGIEAYPERVGETLSIWLQGIESV